MINYVSKTIHVDRETGEILTKKNALTNYKKIKTTKSYDHSETTETKGYKWGTVKINYITEYDRDRQRKLF